MRLLYFTAGLMLAHQALGKIARDALFISYFGEGALSAVKGAAALCSIAIGLNAPRLFYRYGTARTVPAAFVFSGLLHFLEFAIRDNSPKAASVLVYLHVVSLSAILISSFWLLLGERFDPAEARRWFGRISGLGAAGAISGSLLAAAVSSSVRPGLNLFFLMGVFHLVCGICILLQSWRAISEPDQAPARFLSPFKALSAAPYLRTLALLVFLGTTAGALIELRFLSATSAAGLSKGELVRYNAIYQTVTQVACFLLQTLVVRHVLKRYSIGANIGALPATIALSSLGSILVPGLGAMTVARALENVVRGSVYRSGYEAFYAPVPPVEKRAAKSIIDVVCDRAGDAAGALIITVIVLLGGSALSVSVPIIAIAIAGVGLIVTIRLGRSYSHVVHRGLTGRAQQINEHLSRFGDWSLDTVLLDSSPMTLPSASYTASRPALPVLSIDETTRRLSVLRSGDPQRVRRMITLLDPPDPVLVPCLIELLGWSEVWKDARAALVRTGPRHIGQFVDALSDSKPAFPFAACGGVRAAEGLACGLEDTRFEIRFHCARSLDVLVASDPTLCPPHGRIVAASARELSVSPQIWQSLRSSMNRPPSPLPKAPDFATPPARLSPSSPTTASKCSFPSWL
jgi:hypothetical protein